MTDGPRVAVCIPVAGDRNEAWWSHLVDNYASWMQQGIKCSLYTATSGMQDIAKNIALDQVRMNGKNDVITSENRNSLFDQAIPDHDFIYFIDHDTVPSPDSLPRLLAHNRPFVCGVYYHRNDPHLPLMYRRRENGLYSPIRDFERGALFPVDATGLGIALISTQVMTAIREQYVQFERWNGSRLIMHRDDIHKDGIPSRYRAPSPQVWDDGRGVYEVVPLRQITPELEEHLPYPYFDMESGRTEDIGFCERAIRCGFTPWVDTSIEAVHWHYMPVTGDMFRTMRDMMKERGLYSSEVAPGGIPE